MGALEAAGQPAVASVVAALNDSSAVVRVNAAEVLGWLTPVEDPGLRADAVAGLARLLSDPDPTVQAQAVWALGEMGIEPSRLALNPAPIPARNPSPPILAPTAAHSVAPASPAASPEALADVRADYLTLAAMAALLVLALLAVVLTWKGPRPALPLGHA